MTSTARTQRTTTLPDPRTMETAELFESTWYNETAPREWLDAAFAELDRRIDEASEGAATDLGRANDDEALAAADLASRINQEHDWDTDAAIRIALAILEDANCHAEAEALRAAAGLPA